MTYNVSLVERLIRYAYAPLLIQLLTSRADFEVEECLSCLFPLDFFKSTCPTNANLYHANIITTWFRIYLHRTNARANIYEQVARRNHRPWRECSLFSVMHFCQKLLTHFIIFNKKYSTMLSVYFWYLVLLPSLLRLISTAPYPASLINLLCVYTISSLWRE